MNAPSNSQDEGKPRLLVVSHVDIVVRFLLPHMDAARAAGFEVEVACRITRHGDEVRAHADHVWEMPFSRSPLHPGNAVALAKLTRLIRERRYTLIHAHTPSGGVVGRLAATLARSGKYRPLRLYTAHGFHFHAHGGKLSNTIFRTIEAVAGHAWSDGVMVINGEDYDAGARGVVPRDRLFWTRGVGLTTDKFDAGRVSPDARNALRRELFGDQAETGLLLALVAEMIPRKRHRDALAAFARIRARFPDAVFAIAGDGPLMEDLKREAETLGITNAIRFLGFRRDIEVLYSATDLLLFPSAQEGLPCAVQEALGMGVPVIAADVRGSRDLVDDHCGRLVPLGDVEAFANAACELLALPRETQRAMGEAGRQKMAREYNRSRCVAEWQGVYVELMQRHGVAVPPGLAQMAACAPVIPPSAAKTEETSAKHAEKA